VPSILFFNQDGQIQRHGSRSPTSGAGIFIQVSVLKLLSARYRYYADHRMEFLSNYTYDLGQNDLLPLGASECDRFTIILEVTQIAFDSLRSFLAGALQFERYCDIVGSENLPFVRASSSKRVIESAINWTPSA
jgi:hypothetical protein